MKIISKESLIFLLLSFFSFACTTPQMIQDYYYYDFVKYDESTNIGPGFSILNQPTNENPILEVILLRRFKGPKYRIETIPGKSRKLTWSPMNIIQSGLHTGFTAIMSTLSTGLPFTVINPVHLLGFTAENVYEEPKKLGYDGVGSSPWEMGKAMIKISDNERGELYSGEFLADEQGKITINLLEIFRSNKISPPLIYVKIIFSAYLDGIENKQEFWVKRIVFIKNSINEFEKYR